MMATLAAVQTTSNEEGWLTLTTQQLRQQQEEDPDAGERLARGGAAA